MPLLNCPKEEALLQYLSIPKDISWNERLRMKMHLRSCVDCLDKSHVIQEKLQAYFSPKTDITSSLLKVYSRLQNDETLILKGWKLSEITSRKSTQTGSSKSWVVRTGLGLGLGSLLVLFLIAENSESPTQQPTRLATGQPVPFAQIRFQDRNRVQVQYLKPELVQSVEFETTGRR